MNLSMRRNLTAVLLLLLTVLATTTGASPPAHAQHPTGVDPCLAMFQDPRRPLALDVQDRVRRFLQDGMKTDAYDLPTAQEARCGKTHDERCDVVVASGTGAATPQTAEVTAALRSQGLAVCHFGVDSKCVYGARNNAQQNDIENRRSAKAFVSVEVRTPINTGQAKDRFLLARTVAKALTE